MRRKQLILIRILLAIFLTIFTLCILTVKTEAASTSLSASSTSVTVGTKVTITASGNAASWDLEISGDGVSSTKIVGYTDDAENGSFSKSVSFTPKSAGTYTITLTGNVTDEKNTEATSVSRSISIKVKEASSGGDTEESGSSKPSDNETETPSMSFDPVNETVYATDSLNVRSSPSTSGSIIGSLSEGDSATRTGIGDGWSRVVLNNGTKGYVSSSYLDTTKPKTTENDKKDEEDDKKNDDNEDKSNAKQLSSLTVEQYKLEPDFNPDITEYSLTVGKDVEDLVIEAVAADENATVEITGNNGLLLGENTVNIKVTAEDGTVRTYKINVTKVEEIGIQLAELTVENYALSPEFSSDVYEYTLNIGDISVTSLNIIAKSNNENVNVEIAGNNNLKPGENIITILVSSNEGDTTTVYQIIVNIDEAFKNQVATTDNSNMYMYIGVGAAVVILLIIIIVVVRKRRKAAEEEFAPLNTYDLNFSSNNNVTNKDAVNENDIDTKEEKTRKKKKDKLEEEEYSLNSNGYDSNETPRKRGKHF